MQKEIISKWVVNYKKWNLAITEDKEVYDIDTITELVKYWNNGTIAFRIPKTAKRIGVKTINKMCVKKLITIQHYCPF